jgi:hypothetical protein
MQNIFLSENTAERDSQCIMGHNMEPRSFDLHAG